MEARSGCALSKVAPVAIPTLRRRQRLSSSATAPAERSLLISSRAISFLISTGSVSSASASVSFVPKVKVASPSGRPLRSSPRTRPDWVEPAAERSTLTESAAAVFSAAVSAFPEELYQAPRSWTEKAYPKLIHYNKLPKGGHFAAWEQPELFVGEMRAGFRSLR